MPPLQPRETCSHIAWFGLPSWAAAYVPAVKYSPLSFSLFSFLLILLKLYSVEILVSCNLFSFL